MSFVLPKLSTKKELDDAIKLTDGKVLILRFGRENDSVCLHLDDILLKSNELLSRMARIYLVEVDSVPVYRDYFDITIVPATVFFFNAQHIRVDWGMPDNTKYIGSFKSKQDFIDVVEVVYRGALKGKLMLSSPLDQSRLTKYDVLYKGY